MIKIGDREIGNWLEPFIVAEAGINHNGDLDKAFAMVEVAKKSGADAIKFQTFKAEEFISDESQLFTYYSQGKEVTESMLKMFKRYEFRLNEWKEIKKKCDEEEILFLSTPQNRSDLDLLLGLGIPAIKVGSDDFTNIPLLKSYTETNLPLILSCGMSNMAEVYEALEAVGSLEGYPTILLLCTSLYPTDPENVNLLRLKTLEQSFSMVPIGFSDHTQGSLASSLAVGFGACFFEKHFTLDNNLPGPDHWFSENPEDLKTWVDSIRTSYIMMGSKIVRPTGKEIDNKLEFQRYIVAATDIKKGDKFTHDNLTMRRVSGGGILKPSMFYSVVGKTSSTHYKKGEAIGI